MGLCPQCRSPPWPCLLPARRHRGTRAVASRTLSPHLKPRHRGGDEQHPHPQQRLPQVTVGTQLGCHCSPSPHTPGQLLRWVSTPPTCSSISKCPQEFAVTPLPLPTSLANLHPGTFKCKGLVGQGEGFSC